MGVELMVCPGCGRPVARWDGDLFELGTVPTGSQHGRCITAVRVPGGAVVVDVRSLAVEPESAHPQHLCSGLVHRPPRRAADG